MELSRQCVLKEIAEHVGPLQLLRVSNRLTLLQLATCTIFPKQKLSLAKIRAQCAAAGGPKTPLNG
jgi:hypothetical protein